MDATPSAEIIARLSAATKQARENGSEMLSVAFPSLPARAFDALARATPPRISFYFENEKKELAEAGLDFRDTFPRYEQFDFAALEKVFPKNRTCLSLAGNPDVPAPKIFVTGTFDASATPFAAIPTWQLSRTANETRISAHVTPKNEDFPSSEELFSEYARLKTLSEADAGEMTLPEISAGTEAGGENYEARAIRAIKEIEAGNFEKIVLARAKDFTFPEGEKCPTEALYAALRERFLKSGCTIFSAHTSARHTHEKIIGASPEILASVRNRRLATEALAGTVANNPNDPDACAEQLFADDKERREHQFVVDFIAEKLRAAGLHPKYSQTPEILRLPNVFHLHTPIEADICSEKISVGQIVSDLHPTPAMCGIPATAAKAFICTAEPFPRENFSAPVGFLDADGNGFFAVAIRCAKIFENKIRLYAGSGLVKGSRPQREYCEIEAKISALASVFNRGSAFQKKILEKARP